VVVVALALTASARRLEAARALWATWLMFAVTCHA
jgi:hypothetical protein